MIRRDLLLKKCLILVLDCPVFPVCLSRVSFQISFKMAISSFEKIIKYIGGWNIEQMLLDYDYHPLNGQMMRSI